ncbi:MAG: hypothetical protein C6H99_05815, partial [Epsilonproteobacteria bacterium]|nr:hypothetical protein [Campylobacterota bacterium]NPA64853.1 OprD family porin [Campylobacterota bacterium]
LIAQLALGVVALAQQSVSTFEEALKEGRFSANMRLFYMVRTYDEDKTGIPDAKALTFGGIVKYQSASLNGFDFGFAYYGSHRVGGFFSREEGIGTSLLQPDGEDISFLGEAYVEYKQEDLLLKVGRQRLSTPLMNDHDLRMLPSVYEAAKLQKGFGDVTMELGYVQSYSGFVSKLSGFDDMDQKWGEDGLGYIYMIYKGIEDLTLRAQYIAAISDTDSQGNLIAIGDYRYADLSYKLPYGTRSYFKAQIGGNNYYIGEDSLMYGAKVGTGFGESFDIALLFDKIEDNNFKAVEAGPMYSDWQQGYGPYEPSTAYGAQMWFKPFEKTSLKLGYVKVNSDTPLLIDDYAEFNLDLKYAINSYSKLRIRFSRKDQSSESEALRYDDDPNNGGREDRDDFRIIYYINF